MLTHLFITNSNKALIIKSLRQSMLNIKVYLATKTKTYYEVLGVPHTATYNEIKSAYYELSLKYHPDKNKDELAKIMFQEIADAYEILSKYDTRRKYDKTLLIKLNTLHHHEQPTKEAKYSKKTKIYRPPGPVVYNFDEWLRAHYSEVIRTEAEMKIQVQKAKEERELLRKHYNSKIYGMVKNPYINLLFLILLFPIIYFINSCYTKKR